MSSNARTASASRIRRVVTRKLIAKTSPTSSTVLSDTKLAKYAVRYDSLPSYVQNLYRSSNIELIQHAEKAFIAGTNKTNQNPHKPKKKNWDLIATAAKLCRSVSSASFLSPFPLSLSGGIQLPIQKHLLHFNWKLLPFFFCFLLLLLPPPSHSYWLRVLWPRRVQQPTQTHPRSNHCLYHSQCCKGESLNRSFCCCVSFCGAHTSPWTRLVCWIGERNSFRVGPTLLWFLYSPTGAKENTLGEMGRSVWSIVFSGGKIKSRCCVSTCVYRSDEHQNKTKKQKNRTDDPWRL